jgi:hypothetical protein
MRKRSALLTVLAGLVLGIASGLLLGNVAAVNLHTSVSCMLLGAAEKAQYLDQAKREALIDRLVTAKSLDAGARESAASLRSGCLKF